MHRELMLLKIAEIGHPTLRQRAQAVSREQLGDPTTQAFIDALIATMRDANGAGLAAPQVYDSRRICVVEVEDNPRYPYKPRVPLTVLVNPRLTPLGDYEPFANFEGCLSVPNLRGRVPRHPEVRVEAWDRRGGSIDFVARGITAGTFQHEVDHLDGVLFVDRVADPTSLCTWQEFARHHEAQFAAEVAALVERWGS